MHIVTAFKSHMKMGIYLCSFQAQLFPLKQLKPIYSHMPLVPHHHHQAFTSFVTVAEIARRHHRCFSTLSSTVQITKEAPLSDNHRRSANYKPNIWKDEFVKSLKSHYTEEEHTTRKDELKEHVKQLLDTQVNTQAVVSLARLLELIDHLERLGLGYLFKEEIKRALYFTASTMDLYENNDLHATALCFRLFRQHGYEVSQDVFKRFIDQDGNIMACHQNDIKGMLSLFEASNLAQDGESILDQAKAFTSRHLKVDHQRVNIMPHLAELVHRSLEVPLHLRAPRLEARWYIGHYQRRHDANHMILELSKLDFNLVQSTHQEDLIKTSKWWNDLGLSTKLKFSRDRLVECFLFTTALFSEPQFSYCRKEMTKISCMIITIDDIYDVYGTLDELELFTNAVQRWNTDAISQLPYYMKICFSALYNTINEIAYVTLTEKNFDILPCLKKSWADQCKAFLVEAKWYHSGYIPTLEEYMNNALVTAGGPLMLIHAHLLQSQEITTEELQSFLESNPNLIRWSSLILRLTDDLATSTAEIQRGDVPKSIQCYMHKTGASEEVAREYIRYLTDETWKKINAELCRDSCSTEPFISIAVNLARMSECIFKNGDGLAIQDRETKDQILSLFVEPTV